MQYLFPVIHNINDILPAISGRDEFCVKRDTTSSIAIISYNFSSPDTFQDPNSISDPTEQLYAKYRRECRGITFDLNSGDILVRKYHKFHNVNERPEYMMNMIPWNNRHYILEKLDGSMITFFIKKDGNIECHTKMGHTDVTYPVEEFVKNSSIKYHEFVRYCKEIDVTPIFEWCSRQQRIVIDYPEEMLVLTGMRNIYSGEYVLYDDMKTVSQEYGIPLVKAYDTDYTDPSEFVKYINSLKGVEGVVVRFYDGSMCKVKGEEYCSIHRSKETMSREKDVWNLLLTDTVDDAKAFMTENDRKSVDKFSQMFFDEIQKTGDRLEQFVKVAKESCNNKKEFAINYVNKETVQQNEKGLLFQIWDGKKGFDVVKDYLSKNVSTQTKVDAVRNMINNLSWKDYYVFSDDV